jgi:hypothetical protein
MSAASFHREPALVVIPFMGLGSLASFALAIELPDVAIKPVLYQDLKIPGRPPSFRRSGGKESDESGYYERRRRWLLIKRLIGLCVVSTVHDRQRQNRGLMIGCVLTVDSAIDQLGEGD